MTKSTNEKRTVRSKPYPTADTDMRKKARHDRESDSSDNSDSSHDDKHHGHLHTKMQAVRWEGEAFSVNVATIPRPKIKKPLDAIVRLTSAALCGTDMHFYRGRMPMQAPLTFGHEAIGVVEEVGDAITTLKCGDRVVVTPQIVKATDNGQEEFFTVIGLDLGIPLSISNGGQANYIRVPFANSNLLILPQGTDHELDYLLLTDVFPTAWFGLDCAAQKIGDTVVVFGLGPVGLLTVYSAFLRGAVKVYAVDWVPQRLAMAAKLGAIPINFKKVNPVKEIMRQEPLGVDRSIDCVGFECINAKGKNVVGEVLNNCVAVTRIGGGIGVPGAYTTVDQSKFPPHHSERVKD